jgi:hypothetical protein
VSLRIQGDIASAGMNYRWEREEWKEICKKKQMDWVRRKGNRTRGYCYTRHGVQVKGNTARQGSGLIVHSKASHATPQPELSVMLPSLQSPSWWE